ncbi:peroxiredoxin [Oxalobacteraceae bacterium GrIS 2.11]
MKIKPIVLAALISITAHSAQAAIALESKAPDFTLHTMGGPNLRLQEQRGKVVMINFWATWCGPCQQELPHLNQLYEKYRGAGFVMLGVNVDDDAKHAGDVATKLGLKFPVLLDTDKALSKTYDLSTMPSTLLIDREGKVHYIHKGYLAGVEDEYEKQIRELLK